MLDKKLTIYKSLDLHKPAIPPRSHLYHLEPIAVGTPYVESLTGYIARLAEAHCISTGRLISRQLAPLIQEGYVFGMHEPINLGAGAVGSRQLNGTKSMAERGVQALETLTLRDNLRFLTMLTWTHVLTPVGLLRAIRAWCPTCYEEWRTVGQVVYEPLLWALDAVTVCLHHSRHLQTQCPYCHKQIPPLGSRSRPGYCSRCQNWLGISSASELLDREVLSEKELKWQSWVINNTGKLFITAPYLSSAPTRERLTKNIIACINQATEGNFSEFGRLIELPHRQVRTYYVGTSIPQLKTLVRMCNRLGISLLDFLTKETVTINFDTSRTRLQKPRLQNRRKVKSKKPLKEFYNEKAEQALQTALQESPAPSLQELARRLGRVLLKEQRICQLRKPQKPVSQFHNKKSEVRQIIERALEEVLKNEEDPPPSLDEVARCLGYSRATLCKYFPELTSAISARRTSYRNACAVERIERLRQQVRQVVLELHANGIIPQSSSVAKLLTKPGAIRHKEALAALQKVRRELGYEK